MYHRKINFEGICTYVYSVITFMVKIFIAFIYSLSHAVVDIHQLLFNIWIYFKVKSLQRYVKKIQQKNKSFSKDMRNGWHIIFAFYNLFIFLSYYLYKISCHMLLLCDLFLFKIQTKRIQTEHKIYKTKEIQQGRRFYNLIMYFNYFILKVFIC